MSGWGGHKWRPYVVLGMSGVGNAQMIVGEGSPRGLQDRRFRVVKEGKNLRGGHPSVLTMVEES